MTQLTPAEKFQKARLNKSTPVHSLISLAKELAAERKAPFSFVYEGVALQVNQNSNTDEVVFGFWAKRAALKKVSA